MRELVLLCPGTSAEAISDALIDAGVLSVSVEDADIDTDREQPLFGEPGTEPETLAWDSNRIVALLPDGADPAQILELAAQFLGSPIDFPRELRDVPDADWEN